MMAFLKQIEAGWTDLTPLWRSLIESVVLIVALVIVRQLILMAVRRGGGQKALFYWRKGTSYVAFAIGAALISAIWFRGIGELATYLGLVSAGLAVALKDPLTNIFGWMYIIWQRPFAVGDRVEIGGVRGDVVDQRMFAFSMLEVGNWVFEDQSTGRLVHVPNAHVFTQELFNYTQGFAFVWDEMRVMLTFESDWRRGKKLLSEVGERRAEEIIPKARKELERASRDYLIFYRLLSPKVYTSVERDGISLTLRHLTPVRARRAEREALWEDLLDALASEDDIHLAYPTQRLTMSPHDRGPALQAPRPRPGGEGGEQDVRAQHEEEP